MEIKELMEEVLKDTIKYYNGFPERRAFEKKAGFGNTEFCLYKSSDNQKCAIGRLIKEETFKNQPKFLTSNISISEFKRRLTVNHYKDLKNSLKEEYKNLPIKFLIDLQLLHDKSNFWIKKDSPNVGYLSTTGIEFRDAMIEKIKTGAYAQEK